MNLALFDFDGTITSRDTFSGFVRFAVPGPRLAFASVAVSPVILSYRFGLLEAHHARPIVSRVAFRGRSAASVQGLGQRYASEVLPRVVRKHALERIRWDQDRGDTVLVVSASLDVYLKPWCDNLGVEVICTELEARAARLTGRYCDGDCSGPTKARRILQRGDLSRYSVIYAYGDTPDDREMLELAHHKFYRWHEIHDWSEAEVLGVHDPEAVA